MSASISTNAQSGSYYEPSYTIGPYNLTDGASDGNNARDLLFAQAVLNPNATRSVKFHPFPWYSGSNPEKYRDFEWTWRVNISDFTGPNTTKNETRAGAPLIDPHLALTTYDFRWPGGGNLSDQVGGHGTTDAVCISAAAAYTWPGNLTNRYTEGDVDSADCGTVLGAACRDAILRNGTSDRRSCSGPETAWNLLPECADSFGYAQQLTRRLDPELFPTVLTFDINRNNGTRANPDRGRGNDTRVPGNPNLASGSGFFAFNEFPRNDTNLTGYYEATDRFHVVLLSTMLPNGDGGGYQGGAALMCMRVNTTKVEWEGPESAGMHAAGLGAVATAVVGVTMMLAWIM
ncbi:hypothetical protein PG993_008939 [Apiospora rasikravindrae]|uniref:Uncharacterized protein n=1 Tax=Apiospora rasikravindrae TaxID=990691 RepID=A0ABR1SPR3_9PEZI